MPSSSSDNLAELLNQMADGEQEIAASAEDEAEIDLGLEAESEPLAQPNADSAEPANNQPVHEIATAGTHQADQTVDIATPTAIIEEGSRQEADIPSHEAETDADSDADPDSTQADVAASQGQSELDLGQEFEQEVNTAPDDQIALDSPTMETAVAYAADDSDLTADEAVAFEANIAPAFDAPTATPRTRRKRSAKTKAEGNNPVDLKATAAPVLITFGLVMLVPAIWSTLILLGMEVLMHERDGVDKMALFMLVCWPVGLAMLVGGIIFMVQSMRQKKKQLAT